MATPDDETRTRTRHADFRAGFIWAALAIALVGFSIGAHLTSVLGLGFPAGKGFVSFIQVHGHAQLVGWTGLFVIGISLHVMPRLAGVPLAKPQWLRPILWCVVLGLGLRSIGQAVLPYLIEDAAYPLVAVPVVLSGVLEWFGILGYVGLLLGTLQGVSRGTQRPALLTVRPYFGMMVAGWMLYSGLNLVLLIYMARYRQAVVQPAWDRFGLESFIGLVLLPVALAFSVRMLPLYLRLRPADWPVRGTAYAYLLALAVRLLPIVPSVSRLAPQLMTTMAHCGQILTSAVLLWFVWQLDVLTRLRLPWTVHRVLHPGPERRPTRPGLPDYGEFGRFEWLIYAAYAWLVIAALYDGLSGFAGLAGLSWHLSRSPLRHFYLLGFITMLIFGMAVRMVPGLLHRRRVAHPALVSTTFWLGNLSMICRVLLFVLPVTLIQALPWSLSVARLAFALSGLLGLAAVACLAVNLWHTASRPEAEPQPASKAS
jgi:uncharacterized protein involved in response to NO